MRFLVLKPEIEKALAEERSLKGFYELNKDRLNLSYSQLCRYARAFKLRESLETPQRNLFPGEAPFRQEESPQRRVFGAKALQHGGFQSASPDNGAAKPYEPKQYKEESPKKGFHFDPMDAIRKKFT